MPHLRLSSLAFALSLTPTLDAFAGEPPPVVEPLATTKTSEAEAVAPSTPAPDPLPIRIDLDLSKLPTEAAAYFGPDIRAAIDPQLAREPLVVTASAAHWLVIHVELLDPGALDYAIDFELLVDGRPIEPPFDRLHCRLCAQVEVVEMVAQSLPRALASLRAAIQPTPLATAPVEPPPLAIALIEPTESIEPIEPTVPPPELRETPRPPTPPPRVRWLGSVGIIGIVLAVGGTSTVAIGTLALNQGRSDREPVVDLPPIDRDPERWGWLLYGTGLAVTAVGGVMLAADVTALRERRARRVAAHVTLAPTHAGLVVGGRF